MITPHAVGAQRRAGYSLIRAERHDRVPLDVLASARQNGEPEIQSARLRCDHQNNKGFR
jgi:hypothetical protein